MSLSEPAGAVPSNRPTPGVIWLCSLFAPPILSILIPTAVEVLHIPMMDGFGNVLWPGLFLFGVAGAVYAAYKSPLRTGVKIVAVCASIVFLLVACFLALVLFMSVMLKL